jgi:hypothetical protein
LAYCGGQSLDMPGIFTWKVLHKIVNFYDHVS